MKNEEEEEEEERRRKGCGAELGSRRLDVGLIDWSKVSRRV